MTLMQSSNQQILTNLVAETFKTTPWKNNCWSSLQMMGFLRVFSGKFIYLKTNVILLIWRSSIQEISTYRSTLTSYPTFRAARLRFLEIFFSTVVLISFCGDVCCLICSFWKQNLPMCHLLWSQVDTWNVWNVVQHDFHSACCCLWH